MEMGHSTAFTAIAPAGSSPSESCRDVILDDDVWDFVSRNSFQKDYAAVLKRLDDVFNPASVTVELVPNQDDENPGAKTLTFLVKCGQDQKRFRSNCEIFFEPLRAAKPPIYFHMTVLRDF